MIHNIEMTPRIFALLEERRILPKSRETGRNLSLIKRIAFHQDLRVSCWTRHFVRGGNVMVLNSLEYMSYAHSPLHGCLTGAFCSIAAGSKLMGDSHPYHRVSSHPVSYAAYFRDEIAEAGATSEKISSPFDFQQKPARIGDDVWIGADVTLSGGISIGTGAVIAAGAIVTKDVPPYAIVGGVPAKVIKFRFPPQLIRRLVATQWWRYSLADLADFSFDDPEAFCTDFEARKGDLAPRTPLLLTAAEILALH